MRTLFLRRRRFVVVALLAMFLTGILATFYGFSSKRDFHSKAASVQDLVEDVAPQLPLTGITVPGNVKKFEEEGKREFLNNEGWANPNYNVHAFYYAWYGNPEWDGKYIHWNHEYLLHWDANVAKFQKRGQHTPPDDIGANFYPKLGPYSSRDPKVVANHMQQMREAGIGVLVLSWYPPGKADNNGIPVDGLVPIILDSAKKYGLKVTFHIEPYENRNEKTVYEDTKYIVDKYGKHEALYRYTAKDGSLLPMLYIYDSYHTPPEDWAQLLKPGGAYSIRHTPYNCVFIALMVERSHRSYIEQGGFDGFYTYFATDGFTYGSTWRSWPQLQAFATHTQSLFIPSVGPGYIDTNVRPWNSQNTRRRSAGDYYQRSWKSALLVKPEIVSITSFNEWHEGTQIESAVAKASAGVEYKDYEPQGSEFYLQLTKEFAEQFASEADSKAEKSVPF